MYIAFLGFMIVWAIVLSWLLRTDTPGWSRNKLLTILWALVLLCVVCFVFIPSILP